MSQLKIKDSNDNWIDIPAGGIGVPSGGTTGQVLQKSSNTDYATEWATKGAVLLQENLTATTGLQYSLADSVNNYDLMQFTITGTFDNHPYLSSSIYRTSKADGSSILSTALFITSSVYMYVNVIVSGSSLTIQYSEGHGGFSDLKLDVVGIVL